MEEVEAKIIEMLNEYDIEKKIVKDVLNRLNGFGYTPTQSDVFNIGFSILKVDSNIKNICNLTKIPKELYYTTLDLCCGEILLILKNTGKLDDTFNLSDIVNTAKIGDTSITFDNSSSPKQQLDTLIDALLSRGDSEILCYRKMRW